MKRKPRTPIVFFNASVILAGLHAPHGGSGKLLKWQKEKRIKVVISEIVVDEVVRNAVKIGMTRLRVKKLTRELFFKVTASPPTESVEKYTRVVIDVGDAHLLASAKQVKAHFLVSLDKKHVLVLKNKVKILNIVSPKGVIEALS